MALLSWLYALYCFDYKWALMSHPLQVRLPPLHPTQRPVLTAYYLAAA